MAPFALSPASRSAKTSACGSPALGWKPSPTSSPASFTTTQPTIGFGRVLPVTELIADKCRMRDLVQSFVEGDRGKRYPTVGSSDFRARH